MASYSANVQLQQAFVFYGSVPDGATVIAPGSFVLPDNYESLLTTINVGGADIFVYRVVIGDVEYYVSTWNDLGDEVVLNDLNNFSHKWDDLDETVPAARVPDGYTGLVPLYRVVEKGYDGGGTVYVSPTDKAYEIVGRITITNVESGYQLPESGGEGTGLIMGIGASVIALSLLALVVFKVYGKKSRVENG